MARQYFDPPRHSKFRFWLIWNKPGEGEEYFARTVQPLNISRGGIALHLVGPAPPKDSPLWVSLGEDVPDMTLFLAAEVAETKQERRGETELRLLFKQLCPEDFYKAVTREIVADRPAW
jgi:hypothetical protein